MTSWSCRVSYKRFVRTPRVLSTGNSGDFPPQSLGVCVFCFVLFAGNRHVRVSCQLRGQKKKIDSKFVPQKITQLISRHFIQETGYEAGTGIARLLNKASNTGFSRHIKTRLCVKVLLCFIKPILGNRYVRSRGFIVSVILRFLYPLILPSFSRQIQQLQVSQVTPYS